VCPHVYTPVEQEVTAGQFHVHDHPGVLKKNVNMNGNILQRYFTHKKILGVPISVANVFWRKTFISSKQTFQKSLFWFVNTIELPLVRGDDVIGRCSSETPPSLRWKSSPVHFFFSVQCCQLSNFVARFSDFSDPFSDFFFKKSA